MSGTARASLRVNFSWMLFGNLVYAAAQFGIVSAMAKVGDRDALGVFTLALALTAPVFAFTNLNLRAVLATDAEEEYPFSHYFGQRLLASGSALVVIAGVLLVSGYALEVVAVTAVVGLSKCVESVSDIFYGLFQRRERMDGIARSLILRGPPNLILIAVLLWVTGSLVWALVGQLVLWAAVLLLHDLPRARVVLAGERLAPQWVWRTLKALSWTALPLGVAILLDSLNVTIPRYVLERHVDFFELGVFGGMFWLVQAGQTVIRSLGQAAVPRLAAHYAAGRIGRFVKLVLALQGFAIVVGAGGIAVAVLLGEPLLTLVYTAEHAAYSDVFVVVMLAGALTYMTWFFMNIVTAARFFRPQVPIAISATATTLGACLLWVPEHGILGAAWAWVAAQVVLLAWGIGLTAFAIAAPRKHTVDEGTTAP